jgi:hypothetical protein
MAPTKRLIVAAVFLILAAALILIVKYVPLRGEAEETATADVLDQLFPEAVNKQVVSVQVTDNETGEVFSAQLEDDVWTITQAKEGTDTGLGVNQGSITNQTYFLPLLRPTRVLDQIESLAPFGLDSAQYTVQFTLDDGSQYSFDVGVKNPDGSSYYVRLPGDPNVYLIAVYNLETLLGFVEEPPYIQPTPDMTATWLSEVVTPTPEPTATPTRAPTATPTEEATPEATATP